MNPEEILAAARKAIADGESPDDVARWIEESTGWSLVEMAEQQEAQMRLAAGGGSSVTDKAANVVSALFPAAFPKKEPSPAGGGMGAPLNILQMLAEGATLGRAGSSPIKPSTFARPDDPRWTPEGAQAAAEAFQQRTDDLQTVSPVAANAVGALGAAAGLYGVGRAGLAPAVSAIRGVGGAAASTAANPLVRNIMGRWLPGGGLTYLLLDKMFGK